MYENFTSLQFCQWLEMMCITSEEAAVLLKTSMTIIQGYIAGSPTVTPKHSGICRFLLFKKIALKKTRDLASVEGGKPAITSLKIKSVR